MIRPGNAKASKLARAGIVAALAMLLAACLLTPGKFASSFDVRKDGHFTFTYTGELYFISPDALSDDAKKANQDAVFKPEPCHATDGAERECSAPEVDRQMREWQSRQKAEPGPKSRESEKMAAMMGGKDMSDPRAAQEFARSLERQAGWRKVTYKGNGLFLVDYAISGTLDHDFVFPVMEGFPMANPFVLVTPRQDGSVRVDAPGYSIGPSGGPLRGLASLMAMDQSEEAKKKMAKLPKMDGTFAVTTDGAILANNTDEGPAPVAGGSRLSWTVTDRNERAPTALIRLSR